MSSGVAGISRKFKALFRWRHDGQGSPARVDPQNPLGENTDGTSQRSSVQALPPRSLTPPIGREPYPRLIDTRDDSFPYLETPATGLHRRPRSAGGRAGAPFPEASPPVLTPPLHLAASHGASSDEQGEPDRLGTYPPNPYLDDHHRAATLSPYPSIAPSIGPLPSTSQQGQHLPLSTSTTNITTGGSSYFAGAQGVSIHHQQINHTNLTASKTVFEHLREHIVHGAAHDSDERCDAPACHKETRVAIRQNIMSWITHGDRAPVPKRIMWLSGPAGGGKTAIAGSVAVACKEQGLLAGTFMFSSFSGSPGRMSKRGVIVTLAYHMSQHKSLRLFAARLLMALEEHPDIFHKQLKEQAECLILAPFRSIDQEDRGGWPNAAIIVDGLDEVVAAQHRDTTGRQRPRTSEEDQVEILDVLLTLSQSPSFPFRIFISSRPESNITQFFEAGVVQCLTLKLFLDSKYDPDADIQLFLESKFAEIRRRRRISDAWPGVDVIDRLVDMSSGQFIVPTTVLRWVGSGVPQRQLDEVLELQKDIIGPRNPFASLDILYRHILLRACDPDDDPRLIVKWILLIQGWGDIGDYSTSVTTWRHFLQDTDGEFNYRMEQLASLISIPLLDEAPIKFYHKSLADFLSAKSRCGDDLYVSDTDMYPFIARRLLQTFKKKQVDIPFPLPAYLLKQLAYLITVSNIRLSTYEGQEGIMDGFLLCEAPTPDSRAALSACDIAWWVYCIFNGDWLGVERTIGGVYCTIHKAMECNRNTPSSHEHSTTNQTRDSECHETCVRWRRDILAKAKELGWCMHRLEQIEVDELENVKWDHMEGLFRNVHDAIGSRGHGRGCDVCRIPALKVVKRQVW